MGAVPLADGCHLLRVAPANPIGRLVAVRARPPPKRRGEIARAGVRSHSFEPNCYRGRTIGIRRPRVEPAVGAIQSYAEAATLYLRANPPNIERAEQILANIQRDDRRAADIISHLRGLLKKKDELELQE